MKVRYKKCNKCHQEKREDEFYSASHKGRKRVRPECKACNLKLQKKVRDYKVEIEKKISKVVGKHWDIKERKIIRL